MPPPWPHGPTSTSWWLANVPKRRRRPGGEGGVQPSGADQHGHARGLDPLPRPGGRGGHPVEPGQAVIAERRQAQQLLHVYVALVVVDRRRQQGRAVRPVHRLDGARQRELLGRQAGELRQPLDRPGNAVLYLALAHPAGEPAARGASTGIKQLPVRVDRTEQRGDGDHVGVPQAGHQLCGLALVRRAKHTDPTVGPRLGGDPVDQLAVVGDLTRAEFHAAANRTTAPVPRASATTSANPAPVHISAAARLLSPAGPG